MWGLHRLILCMNLSERHFQIEQRQLKKEDPPAGYTSTGCRIPPSKNCFQQDIVSHIIPANTTLAASPANVATSAPANVYLVFVTFAVMKYTDMV